MDQQTGFLKKPAITSTLGATFALSLLLASCGSRSGSGAGDGTVYINEVPASQQREIGTEFVQPYNPDGRYASVLKDCALAASADDLCSLEKLPYIGQENTNPSIQNILDRTLVSHDWMGDRFAQLLRSWPDDVIPLFRTVTAIVIASDVRPASYSSWRGHIQLDPDELWLSLGEKRTVSQSPDYRASYGPDLKFVTRWRLTIGDAWAIPYASLKDDNERELSDIIIASADTIYHELAHANDYMRAEALPDLDIQLTPRDATRLPTFNRLHDELYDDTSLTVYKSRLYSVAGVMYGNEVPGNFQKALLADEAGNYMDAEGRLLFYGYYSITEDVATLFSATMMKLHYGIDFHTAFANKPDGYPDTNNRCNDFKVAWGSRNRLAAPSVAPRAKFVTEKMIGSSARLDQFFATGLGQETALSVGAGWCNSISDDTGANIQLSSGKRLLEADHGVAGR